MEDMYHSIIKHYENCLMRYGDSHLGVDWPSKEDAMKRYQVMLDIVLLLKSKKETYSLLDFGCGTGHLLEYIVRNKLVEFQYSGLDLSQNFIQVCRRKFPNTSFSVMDVLKDADNLLFFDLIVMNGVFTEKRDLTFDQMWGYFTKLIKIAFDKTKGGLSFNVMSKQVDWERSDLFHVSHDLLASYLSKEITRNYVIRNDYGLYEYTVYLYK